MDQIGRYQIEGLLGEGAMGVVYRALDPIIGRDVAIKVFKIDTHGGGDRELQQRFLTEAKAIGRLDHPHIVTIYDVGFTDEGQPYMVMEYLEGKLLTHYLSQGERLPIEQILDLMIQLLDALDYAHKQGIVHRDIKPANIMLTASGRAKIMDFGIAKILDESTRHKLTQSGMIIGTPGYMSPEQVTGRPLDVRSDLFSLGVVLWECLTLKKAFEAETLAGVAYKIVYEKLPSPRKYRKETPVSLEAVLNKALQKSPPRRFSSAAEFRDALKMIREQPWRTTWVQRILYDERRRPLYLASLVLLISALVGSFFILRPFQVGSHKQVTPSELRPPPAVQPKQPAPQPTPEQKPVSQPETVPPQKEPRPTAPPPTPVQPEQSGKKIEATSKPMPPQEPTPEQKAAKKEAPPPTETTPAKTPAKRPSKAAPKPTRPPPAPSKEVESGPQARQNIGFITVRTNAPQAEVFIDQTRVGRAPLERYPVPAGRHRIRIVAPQNPPYETARFVPPQKEAVIDHNFELFGTLIIRVNKPALIYVDGRRVGVGQHTLPKIPFGPHTITVRWQNKVIERRVFVGQLEPQEIKIDIP